MGVMGMVGYMVTWRTYGTWLSGDERGYRDDGGGRASSYTLEDDCRGRLVQEPVILDENSRGPVREAILRMTVDTGEKALVLAVCERHVHLVLRYGGRPIEEVVAVCKTAGRQALRGQGYAGKVWARGYDKQFCFSDEELKSRIEYVDGHDGS